MENINQKTEKTVWFWRPLKVEGNSQPAGLELHIHSPKIAGDGLKSLAAAVIEICGCVNESPFRSNASQTLMFSGWFITAGSAVVRLVYVNNAYLLIDTKKIVRPYRAISFKDALDKIQKITG